MQHQLQTPAGHQITLRVFSNQAIPQRVIVIAPAMGVPQRYYQPVAKWLAEQGCAVITFDYFGMFESAPATLKGLQLDIKAWAEQDGDAVLAFARHHYPEVAITWLAHSVGGQLFGLLPNHANLDRMVTVTTGSGYWLENAPALKRKAWLLWFLVVPLSIPLFGYFPGKRLKMVGDLPASVMWQWRRWCLHPNYLVGSEGPLVAAKFERITTPIVSLSVTDDELLSARNIEAMHKCYRRAPLKFVRIAPADIGVSRIGHFGFFRPEFESSLWAQYLAPALQLKLQPN